MIRILLVLLSIITLVLLMPACARRTDDQRFSRRFRCLCRNAPALALAAHLITTLALTLLSRKPGSHSKITLSLLQPFQHAASEADSHLLEGLFLNVLLFLPLGYLLPQVFPKIRCCQVLLIGAALTGMIELCQFVFGMGWFDVNDLLCNFIGVLAGWFLHRTQAQK